MTRQVEGVFKDKDKIIELLTSILLDYQVRELSHFITRALPEMQARNDDRWQSLMSIYMRQYNKFMKEYHPVAITMAYNQFMSMTLREFAQNYEDMYGVGERNTLYTKHGSLEETLELFFQYCVHALDMSVKAVVDLFFGHFDRTQKDQKKNTIMLISEPSHGKTYLLRSIWACCGFYTNAPQEEEADKFKYSALRYSRHAIFNELIVDQAKVEMLKTICEGSETHVPVKHSERVSIQNVPIYITTNHEMERNLREAVDMEAMLSRIHILRPNKYEPLKDKPYLHLSVWIHGIEYAANKLAHAHVPRPLEDTVISETQEIQNLTNIADADTEEFECNNELHLLQSPMPVEKTPEKIVISPNKKRVKKALIENQMYNPEEVEQTVKKESEKDDCVVYRCSKVLVR